MTVAGGLLVVGTAEVAHAGPPLVTDDPVPTPVRHWEILTPAILEKEGSVFSLQAPHFDVNYGVSRRLQLSVETSAGWLRRRNGSLAIGPTDTALQVKYRFRDRGRKNHRFQLATEPTLFLGTGDVRRGLGAGSSHYELPLLWLAELGSKARLYGDLRAGFQSAPGTRDFFFGGIAFERDLNDRWTLTGEIYGQTPDSNDDAPQVGVNIGFIYQLRGSSRRDPSRQINLLFSVGHGLTGEPGLTLYLGPQFIFR